MKDFNIAKAKYPFLIALIGVALAVYQYIYNRSLWLDEAMLAMEIIENNHQELLQPLGRKQAAPILFLQIEKVLASHFSYSEFGFRLFPLLCFIGSLPLVYKVSKLITANRATALLSLLFFCITPSLLYYSSEAKQYMPDVFISLLLIYIALRSFQTERAKMNWLATTGTVGIFLSNIAVIMLTSIAIYLIIQYRKAGKSFWLLFIPFTAWGLTFLFYYFNFVKDHPLQEFMTTFWREAFMPTNPLSSKFWLWLEAAFLEIFVSLAGYVKFTKAAIFFYIVGILYLVKSKPTDLLLLLIAPVLLHLALSALHLYPFSFRLILYLTPLFIIGISMGVMAFCDWVNTYISSKWVYGISVLAMPLLLVTSSLYKRYPLQKSEVKESLAFLEANRPPSEKLYVHYWATYPFEYYQANKKYDLDTNVIKGQWHWELGRTHGQLAELKQLNSNTWLLFTYHQYPEKDSIFNYLNTNGTVTKKFETYYSSVYFYAPK